MSDLEPKEGALFNEVQPLIAEAKKSATVAVNAELTHLYWQVGKAIYVSLLGRDRADYGKKILASLSGRLTNKFGRGWSPQQLRHCVRFAEIYIDSEIV